VIDEQSDEHSDAESDQRPDQQTEEEQSPAKRRGSFWRELPILLGVAVVVAVLVRAFVLQTFYIPSPSMEHTLNINDRVLVDKLVYDFRSPHRGEVVVFKAPSDWSGSTDGEDFIKRVIGVGGDHVVCCDDNGRIKVNNQPLDEKYLFSQDGVADPPADEPFDVTVPKGRLWVMGDHRSASGDSLEHFTQPNHPHDPIESTISEDAVVGRAFVVFWPVNRATWLSVPGTFDGVPKS
jgi:signal peptidase I